MAVPVKLLRALALGSAGLATFYGAAHLARATKAPDGTELVVRPVTPASATIVPAPLAMASAPLPAASAASSMAKAESAAASGAASVAASGSDLLRGRTVPSTDGQAFARLSWQPPPPPPPPPAPPPPPPPPVVPTAPPLPYAFVGMVESGLGKPQAFLARGEALVIVAAGDILDNNTYRVDSLSANQVVITYLPLNMKQTIDVQGGLK